MGSFTDLVTTWASAVVFLVCGVICLTRGRAIAAERAPWTLIGVGLVLYSGGCITFNIELTTDAAVSFPSLADMLWLSLYPLSFAGMVGLVRARRVQVNASLWLDAVIGGSAVAAAAAVVLLPPVFDLTEATGWASAAQVAYPLCDLLLMGFAVVLWGTGRWRLDTWLALAAGFALIAVSDSVYLVAQAGDGWTSGSLVDLPTSPGRSCSPSRPGARSRGSARSRRTRASCCRSRSPSPRLHSSPTKPSSRSIRSPSSSSD